MEIRGHPISKKCFAICFENNDSFVNSKACIESQVCSLHNLWRAIRGRCVCAQANRSPKAKKPIELCSKIGKPKQKS